MGRHLQALDIDTCGGPSRDGRIMAGWAVSSLPVLAAYVISTTVMFVLFVVWAIGGIGALVLAIREIDRKYERCREEIKEAYRQDIADISMGPY